jgi:hypothetical protein
MTHAEALRALEESGGAIAGIGFVLGDGWGGLDLDDCVDPETGELVDPRAAAVLELVPKARAEHSPSGKGLKVVGRAPRWLELTFGKDKVEVRSSSSGYFTMTGKPYREGTHAEDLPVDAIAAYFGAPSAKAAPAAKVMPNVANPGTQNSTMFTEMCALRRRNYNAEEIAAAIWTMVGQGRFPSEAGKGSWTERDVSDMAQRVCARYPAGDDDFTRDEKGVPHKTRANIKRAFRALGARPRWNRFSNQGEIEKDGRTLPMTDETMRALYDECDESLKFKPTKGDFIDVALLLAERDDYHPVRDYLDSLTWDGIPRVNVWLAAYAGAEHTEYTKAVGRLVLVAAVRRVRSPGCKFDELMVLESATQGRDKSNLLRVLCPNPAWFSETLALASDAKVVIERTSGVWIAEAAEMVGNHKAVDQLKSFLSTSTDGPVRLAYEKLPTKVPRQFVVVGTTNHRTYLRDLTGNRRFWPVTVGTIDLQELEKDRDQLWAEAAHLEARGESIRLDRSLWESAAREQDARRVMDPWEEVLEDAFGVGPMLVSSREVWQTVGVPVERRTQQDNERLGSVIRRLGFESCTFREEGIVKRGFKRGGLPTDQLPRTPSPQGNL